MARPTKWRKIEKIPDIVYFAPTERGSTRIAENTLKLEELEAIRLKDLEGLEQNECADRMEVSRPTFQRILLSAREKIADSLVNGKAVNIEGGNFTQNICTLVCDDCGKRWTESFERLESMEAAYTCPSCGSKRVECGKTCKGRLGRGNCWRHGKNGR